ncbi:MAG: histidinol-phosphate transaminase [Chloroflexi bacterium]|nr:histidinol-phosphate transaminase [Chloroflexota bacterium]
MNERTDIRRLMRPHLVEAEPYAAIDPPEVLARMAGIPEEQIIKLDGNENLYGASPGVQQALASCRTYHIYPDPQQRRVRHALAEYAGTTPDRVVAGAGSDELIDLLLRLFVGPGDRVIQSVPTFAMYATFTHLVGGTMVSVPRDETFDLDLEAIGREARQGAKVLFLTSPNNPTGNLVSQETVQESLKMGLVVVVDEAYYEFAGSTVASLVPEHNNLVVLRSFSKWAGLAGLRIGYGLMDPAVAERLLVIKPPYNITVASEIALLASLQDRELLLSRVKSLVEERDRLFVELGRFPQLTPVPSSANFILCRLRQGKGRSLYGELARRGIFVRYYDTPLLRDYIRVSVGLAHHNRALVSALQAILGEGETAHD